MIGARKYQVKVDERRETDFQSKISYYMKETEIRENNKEIQKKG